MTYDCPVCGAHLVARNKTRAIRQHEETYRHRHAEKARALYTRVMQGEVPKMVGGTDQSMAEPADVR